MLDKMEEMVEDSFTISKSHLEDTALLGNREEMAQYL